MWKNSHVLCTKWETKVIINITWSPRVIKPMLYIGLIWEKGTVTTSLYM